MKILDYKKSQDKPIFAELVSPKILRDIDVENTVRLILDDVSRKGDAAVSKYIRQFDKANLSPAQFRVDVEEISDAVNRVEKSFLKAARLAIKNITEYHKFQLRKTRSYQRNDGSRLTQRIRPLNRVGMYVPGGSAPLASSLLMCVVPAKVAGVPEIVMVTPSNSEGEVNPYILASAKLAGVTEMYRVGGVQAIGALAYGTDSIPRVDKIVGPGNKYVVEAKRQVYGIVDVDLIPGPSEILVIADDTANPSWVAADMLSQAEHTGNERVFLVTPSKSLAKEVEKELYLQANQLSRTPQMLSSLEKGGVIVITKDLDQAVEIADLVAAEHLEIMTQDARKIADKVKYAGAIFIGPWTPEPICDYVAGTNHILPTGGTGRMFSGLNLDEFIKKTNVVEISDKGFQQLAESTIIFAEKEELTAHANSVRVRLKNGGKR